MTLEIEKNVPIPKRKAGQAYGTYTDLFNKMVEGDSFIAEGKMASLQSAIRQAAKRAGVKILTRKESDDKLRVWNLGRLMK